MSEEHVAAIFGPPWTQDRMRELERRLQHAERTVLALRRKLRAADPSLPNEYDGTTWALIEATQ